MALKQVADCVLRTGQYISWNLRSIYLWFLPTTSRALLPQFSISKKNRMNMNNLKSICYVNTRFGKMAPKRNVNREYKENYPVIRESDPPPLPAPVFVYCSSGLHEHLCPSPAEIPLLLGRSLLSGRQVVEVSC